MIDMSADALRRVFPGARADYLAAFEACRADLDAAGVTASPLRWSHFLGQVGAESSGLKVIRENMSYSADRIVEVFGARRHSAKVSRSEALGLARNPQALAERVYGLGNPSMAKRLGNTQTGDGHRFRGWGPGQITGRGKSIEYLSRLGLGEDSLDDPATGLKAMLMEWTEKDCNKFADANQIGCVSRAINLGHPYHKATPNGMEHRQASFERAWSVYRDAESVKPAFLRVGDKGPDVKDLQAKLNELGYAAGFADGVFGAQTRRAVVAFQSDRNLKIDGLVGEKTWAALADAQPIERGDRALITANTLISRGSLTVVKARASQARGMFKAISGFVSVGLMSMMPTTLQEVPSAIASYRQLSEGIVGGFSWFLSPLGLLTLAALWLCYMGAREWTDGKAIENRRVEDARTGANLAR